MAKRGHLGYDGTPAGAGALPSNPNSAGSPQNPRQGIAMPGAERAGHEPGDGEQKAKSKGPCTCDPHDLKRRFDSLRTLRKPVEGIWDQIERYFFPLGSMGRPYTQMTESNTEWNRTEVWDSTAIDAAQKLAASIHGSVTSPAARWFKLAWRDKDLKDDTESAKWLEDKVSDIVFDTLQDSDFNSEIAAADQDLVGFGNTVIFEEAAHETEWKGVDFEAVPLREWFFEANSKGGIDTGYRLLSWTPVQIVDMCRRREWTVPEKILDLVQKPESLSQPLEIVFAIFQRPDAQKEIKRRSQRNRDRAATRKSLHAKASRREKIQAEEIPSPDEPTYPLLPEMRGWGCVYFFAENGDSLGEEGGYYEIPVVFGRWQKTAGSIWGHGLCHTLLPTVKYLNAWMETEHQAAAKAVDPPMAGTKRGVLSDLDLRPGGFTLVAEKDSIFPLLPDKARFDVSEKKLSELRAMVQRGLHNDELTLRDSPAMTATEVQARYELMNRVLGSTLARIENDILAPIIHITIGHLLRAKQLPEMPPKVLAKYQAGDLDFNIEYQGPLARSQRTDEVAAIERVISFAAALLKMGIPVQVVMATIDVVAAIREVAQRLGTPAGLLKGQEEVQKAMESYQQEQARAAAAVTAKTEGEAQQAHAGAAASLAQAMAAHGAGPAKAGVVPTPAQPVPVVSPSYGPASPFAQPAPSM